MTRSFKLFPALLAGLLGFAAQAQEASTPAAQKSVPHQVEIRAVKVKARINPGDLAYNWVFEDQKLLQSYLPAKEGLVDFTWRITFTELHTPEQDTWIPQDWGVALVANGFEQNVPVARGGYFLLPALPASRRGATLMFHEQSLKGHIGAAWRIRVGADQHLSYAGFQQAMDEVLTVQRAIPLALEGLRLVRTGRYDALKACFLGRGGQVLIDGLPAADASFGNCVLLKFDPARATSGQVIEFKGPLDIVTLVESADYDIYLDPPAPARAQVATETTVPTNLSDLSYKWNFKRQLRLQHGLPARTQLVDFVWRMSLDGLSEAEQDAWAPQGWTLALTGKDFANAVPVARGGYFLLPALPSSRQDASLTFREQTRRHLIGASWVVRPREGEHPYLYKGDIGEAMKAVRKAQDAIPDSNAELAALRAAHYDGLKACFLDPDGTVTVGDAPTADATVGNCRVLKFDPSGNVRQKVEFIGRLDAVTVIDTAPYLQHKG